MVTTTLFFIASATAAALSLVITLFLSVPEMKLPEQQAEGTKRFKFNNFFESKVIPISIVIIVIYFCYSSVLSFLALYSKEIHLVDAASFFFVIYALAAFFSRPFVGRLFDSRGENLIMYSAILFFIVGMVTLSQARHGYILLLSGALIALGFGSIQSVCQAITTKIAPPHRLGLATSTFFMFTDLGTGIGPFIFGLFIPFIGYSGIYLVAAIVALACVFLYYFLHGKKATRTNV
jgi:MFS family permease